MRRFLHRREPLHRAGIRESGHPHLSVDVGKRCHPLDRVVAILRPPGDRGGRLRRTRIDHARPARRPRSPRAPRGWRTSPATRTPFRKACEGGSRESVRGRPGLRMSARKNDTIPHRRGNVRLEDDVRGEPREVGRSRGYRRPGDGRRVRKRGDAPSRAKGARPFRSRREDPRPARGTSPRGRDRVSGFSRLPMTCSMCLSNERPDFRTTRARTSSSRTSGSTVATTRSRSATTSGSRTASSLYSSLSHRAAQEGDSRRVVHAELSLEPFRRRFLAGELENQRMYLELHSFYVGDIGSGERVLVPELDAGIDGGVDDDAARKRLVGILRHLPGLSERIESSARSLAPPRGRGRTRAAPRDSLRSW